MRRLTVILFAGMFVLATACGSDSASTVCELEETQNCTTDDGSAGTQVCTDQQVWSACAANCTAGEAIQCTTTCGTFGQQLCNVDGAWDECIPPEEQCDGKDNDCDGAIDEGLGGEALTRPCACGDVTGVETCAAMAFGPCSAGVASGTEICDGKDNDCNSLIDEGCDDDGDGFCDKSIGFEGPVAICANGGGDCDDTVMAINPDAAETCDNKDNNCDGEIDNGLAPLSCGLGACNHEVPSCVAGAVGTCDPMEGATDEVCDDVDNNCNGEVDEGVEDCCDEGETMACGLDEGECKKGEATCGADKSWGACDGSVEPTNEICDGKDNDCDGDIDNNTVDAGAPCYDFSDCEGAECVPTGECIPGAITCKHTDEGGQVVTELVCEGSVEPVDEVCDGKDNNCDGTIDEGMAVDEYEANNTCTDARVLLADTGLEEDSDPFTINATIYTQDGAPDEDWYNITAKELSDLLPACGFSLEEPCLVMEIAITSPAGLPLEFCVYEDGCEAEKLIGCTTPDDPFFGVGWHNYIALNADFNAYIQVFNKDQGLSCEPYLLTFLHYNAGCPEDGKCPWEEGYVAPEGN